MAMAFRGSFSPFLCLYCISVSLPLDKYSIWVYTGYIEIEERYLVGDG